MEEYKEKVAVIGGGYAGVMAVARLAKQLKKQELILINNSPYFKERIRNHEIAADAFKNELSMKKLIPPGCILKEGTVTKINPEQNLIEMEGEEGRETLTYSYLILAAGSSAEMTSENTKFYSINSEFAAIQLQQELKKKQNINAAVIGAGLSGIELTSELSEKYKELTLHLFDSGEIGSQFSPKGKYYIRKILQESGVILHDNCRTKINGNSLESDEGISFAADIIIRTAGFQCRISDMLSGVKVNENSQIIVDSHLRSLTHRNIFAAGDSAWIEGKSYQGQRMSCAFAMPMGAHAADNIARLLNGEDLKPFGFKFVTQCVSLGRKKGLIQFVTDDDRPLSKILTGKTGALIKELVSRYTVWMLRLEVLFGFRLYTWPGKNTFTCESPNAAAADAIRI